MSCRFKESNVRIHNICITRAFRQRRYCTMHFDQAPGVCTFAISLSIAHFLIHTHNNFSVFFIIHSNHVICNFFFTLIHIHVNVSWLSLAMIFCHTRNDMFNSIAATSVATAYFSIALRRTQANINTT